MIHMQNVWRKDFTKIKYDLNLGKANMEYRMANGMKEMMDAIEQQMEMMQTAGMQMRHLHIHGQIHRYY